MIELELKVDKKYLPTAKEIIEAVDVDTLMSIIAHKLGKQDKMLALFDITHDVYERDGRKWIAAPLHSVPLEAAELVYGDDE